MDNNKKDKKYSVFGVVFSITVLVWLFNGVMIAKNLVSGGEFTACRADYSNEDYNKFYCKNTKGKEVMFIVDKEEVW